LDAETGEARGEQRPQAGQAPGRGEVGACREAVEDGARDDVHCRRGPRVHHGRGATGGVLGPRRRHAHWVAEEQHDLARPRRGDQALEPCEPGVVERRGQIQGDDEEIGGGEQVDVLAGLGQWHERERIGARRVPVGAVVQHVARPPQRDHVAHAGDPEAPLRLVADGVDVHLADGLPHRAEIAPLWLGHRASFRS